MGQNARLWKGKQGKGGQEPIVPARVTVCAQTAPSSSGAKHGPLMQWGLEVTSVASVCSLQSRLEPG